jgi:hypothetical protein
MEQDGALGWRVVPHTTASYQMKDSAGGVYPVQYRTGQQGFRQFGDPSAPGARVLVVGDSFTHAIEVSNEQTYFAVLQQRLSQQLPAQVFAYGAGGWGTLQELLLIERSIGVVQPHIVLLQVCANDIVNNSYELELASYANNNRRPRPYLQADGRIRLLTPQTGVGLAMEALASRSRLASWVLVRIDILLASDAGTRTVEHAIRTEGPGHPGFRRAANLTEQLFARLRAVVPPTVKLYAFSVDRQEPFTGALETLLTQQGVAVIEGVADAVSQARLRGETVLVADGAHWAPSGHNIAGNILADRLLTDLTGR